MSQVRNLLRPLAKASQTWLKAMRGRAVRMKKMIKNATMINLLPGWTENSRFPVKATKIALLIKEIDLIIIK